MGKKDSEKTKWSDAEIAKTVKVVVAELVERGEKKRSIPLEDGLYLFVYDTGTVSFKHRFTVPGTKRRVYGDMKGWKNPKSKAEDGYTFKEAAAEVEKQKGTLKEGHDPRLAKRKVSGTLEDVSEEYFGWLLNSKGTSKDTVEKYRREFKLHVYPYLGDRRMGDIDVSELESVMGFMSGPVIHNRVRTVLHAVWKYGRKKKKEGVRDNLAGLVDRRVENDPRERFLEMWEIVAFWLYIHSPDCPFPRPLVKYFKSSMYIGVRPSELLKILFTEIIGNVWTIPASRMKGKKAPAHLVHLVDSVLDIIGTPGNLPAPFPSYRKKGAPCSLGSAQNYLKAAFVVNGGKLNIDPFTPHDIRRTVETHMARIGVDTDTIKRCHAHSAKKIQGISAVYNRYEYYKEKSEAWQKWEQELNSHLKASLATPLRLVR